MLARAASICNARIVHRATGRVTLPPHRPDGRLGFDPEDWDVADDDAPAVQAYAGMLEADMR